MWSVLNACSHEYLIHDRDSIFSGDLDESVRHIGFRVMKTPPRCPKANAICERVIGTIRRECLDWLIPISEAHLRLALKSWIRPVGKERQLLGLWHFPTLQPADSIVAMWPQSVSRCQLTGLARA